MSAQISTESERGFPARLDRWFQNRNIGLGAKMALLVVVGTVALIGLFAYLGTAALSRVLAIEAAALSRVLVIEAAALRALCEVDCTMGYALMRQVAKIAEERLH